MKESKALKPGRILTLAALVLGVMITVLPRSVQAQQEVTPDWFDPWARPATAVAQASQTAVTVHKQHKAAKVVVSPARTQKLHAKRVVMRASAS